MADYPDTVSYRNLRARGLIGDGLRSSSGSCIARHTELSTVLTAFNPFSDAFPQHHEPGYEHEEGDLGLVQPSVRSNPSCSFVSTPSATIEMPRLFPRPVTARTIAMKILWCGESMNKGPINLDLIEGKTSEVASGTSIPSQSRPSRSSLRNFGVCAKRQESPHCPATERI